MKNAIRCLYPLLWLVILCAFSITAMAHSGGTNSKGGHHNGDDYHYHHGYSAHDHYDMDGDGDVDCPYNFVDNVDHNIHNSSSKTPSSASTFKSASKEGDAPIAPLTFATAIVLVLIIAPRHIFNEDLNETLSMDKALSFICSLLPLVVVFLIVLPIRGGIHWAVLSNDDIFTAFLAAAGLGFPFASMAYFVSFFISMLVETLFHRSNILPSYLDSYAFTFALILFLQFIK